GQAGQINAAVGTVIHRVRLGIVGAVTGFIKIQPELGHIRLDKAGGKFFRHCRILGVGGQQQAAGFQAGAIGIVSVVAGVVVAGNHTVNLVGIGGAQDLAVMVVRHHVNDFYIRVGLIQSAGYGLGIGKI